MTRPLFLVGFMAAGKSSVGRAIAARTGRRFVDLDDEIAKLGEPVAQLVARDEAELRRREALALAQVIAEPGDPIVATGGGCAAYGDNVVRMRAAGAVVALDVDVAEAKSRASGGPPRPLLANAETLARARAPHYRRAHAVVWTGGRSIDEVARRVQIVEPRAHDDNLVVELDDRTYSISFSEVANKDGRSPSDGFTRWSIVAANDSLVLAITDRNVVRHHPIPAKALPLIVEPGEASKSFATYERLCNDAIALGLDRSSTIVAFGGGVVGDLAGFVAATLFRGIRVIQIPTTLVAMTDSAIGGKTAIDLPAGKNLVGAFHQPSSVICNLATLATLPERERRAGFGELWKYALLDGRALWGQVEACTGWAAAGGPVPAALRDVIRACAAYKAAIVSRDERERTGARALLNLGHTVGHAIEAASGLHHGEAVGLGLVAACRVSAALGACAGELEREVADVLTRTGLPATLDPYLTDDVLDRLVADKKRVADQIRFIMVREVGACEPAMVPVTELRRILRGQ